MMNDSNVRLSFLKALPFYLVFLNIPILIGVIWLGGAWIACAYVYFLVLLNIMDKVVGVGEENLDPLLGDGQLFWYTLVTKLWPLAQLFLIFFTIITLSHGDYSLIERTFIMIAVGSSSGVAGIVIAHELIHQSNRFERFLGDALLGMVLYGHFRTEHLLVHHRHVATPHDAVTARYNEGLYAFLLRVIPQSFRSAFRAEKALLAKKGLPVWSKKNPFYRYAAFSASFLILAYALGGGHGVAQFFAQAVTAILLLETTNYIEHYGLCRRYLGNGKFENIAPRHSWNANHRVTNWLMINLQRHSDHHYKPARRFPLLQALDETEAPQLPYGYLLMAAFAASPFHWRKLMNPRVRRWRSMYYPDIVDWKAYNNGTIGMDK